VLGVVTAARYAPLLLLGAWGGLVADRHDKRLLLRLAAIIQLVVAAVLGVLTMTHVIDVWSLTTLILVAGVVDVVDTPSRQAFMNNIVGRDRIGNAIALNSVLVNGARVVGPGIAGFVISTVGVGPCFLLNAASFGATWLGLQLMRRDELIPTAVEVAAKRQIRAGLRYVLSTPDLRTPLLLVAVAGAFAWEFPVSIPLFTSDTFHGGASEFGWALSAISAGSIAGGLLAARRRVVSQRSVAGIGPAVGDRDPRRLVRPVAGGRVRAAGGRRVRRGDVQRDVEDVPADHVAGPDARPGDGAVVDRLAGHHRARRPVVGVLGQTLGGRYGLAFGGICCIAVAVPVLLSRSGGGREVHLDQGRTVWPMCRADPGRAPAGDPTGSRSDARSDTVVTNSGEWWTDRLSLAPQQARPPERGRKVR
jgi:MFS family permease